ncbi:MAG: hypothetical protein NEHIOOID_01033 [Holosporales bacterium]
MSDGIKNRLLEIKEQLLVWPEGAYQNKNGIPIDADEAFKIIEADLQNILDRILEMPEDARQNLKDVIDDFKTAITVRHEEAEQNLKIMREKTILTQGTAKAMKAYGQSMKAADV